MIATLVEFLFNLSGLIVFCAEIFSSIAGMFAVVYTSWKIYKQLEGKNEQPRGLIPEVL